MLASHPTVRRASPLRASALLLAALLVPQTSVIAQSMHVGARKGAHPTLAPNAIVTENSLVGNPPSEWDIIDCGDDSIQGYAAELSVKPGETVQFKIKTPSTNYRLDLYRMGYYGGMGARRITTIWPSVQLPQTQPDCATDPTVGLADCGTWHVSAQWFVPPGTVSGIYFVKLVRQDTSGAELSSHVYFIVRDDDGHSDLLFQTSDSTWQAYNSYGGASLYKDFQFNLPAARAYKVSYNRPFNTRKNIATYGNRSFLFYSEYPMVRWLEANGYDVSYATGIDVARYAGLLTKHKVVLSVGQDEYWSKDQRSNFEAARDQGVGLAFLSGNTCFWKTRWEASIDGSAEPYKTLVCYKETKANAKIDPEPLIWTGAWRDPRFSPPADGGRPDNSLKGLAFTVNGLQNDSIEVPAADGKMRLWRSTSVANLAPDATAVMPVGTLGHEWDMDVDNGLRPPGLFHMSTREISLPTAFLLNYGSTFGAGDAVHNLSMYRHASGALVFDAGTIQWSWGLDSVHDGGPSITEPAMQQATVNLLADMGSQPMSIRQGLVPASPSADTQPPSSLIVSPSDRTTVIASDLVTITGTALDAGGGVVAAVEVSIDGGVTWHPASGRETWSYLLQPGPAGQLSIYVRAVDDSGNLETTQSHIALNRVDDVTSPLSVFGWNAHPIDDSHSGVPTTVGVKFRSDVAGFVTGVRYYKGGGNNGTHAGKLWTASGTLLGSATYTFESYSGWQQVLFATPVPIDAGTTYIASLESQAAHAVDDNYFTHQGVDSGVLHALQSGADGGNGVHAVQHSAFPDHTLLDRNYWVDVLFETTAQFTARAGGTLPGHPH